MPKERSINPAQAARKAEKAKAIKKGKAENQSRRNEQLAKKNPDRLERQLNDLKAIQTSGGTLTAHETNLLQELEKDIKAVRRAREALGDKAPPLRGFSTGKFHDDTNGPRPGGVLGKRRREGEINGDSTEESEVDEEVRQIPMPRDTPPPIPKEILDRWHSKRRERMGITNDRNQSGGGRGTAANNTPLGDNRRDIQSSHTNNSDVPKPLPVIEAKTTYEAAPVIRDLRKEAISAFVPAAVRMKLEKSKGIGGLVEPEEADRLEREGYMKGAASSRPGVNEYFVPESRKATMEEVEDDED